MGTIFYLSILLENRFKDFSKIYINSFFGFISLLPFYLIEEIFFVRTTFNTYFFSWVSFAAISPGIIAFTLYTLAQKKLGASITGFTTLYIYSLWSNIWNIII